MVGVVCKIVSCPFYCQGFCGRGITIINNAGQCDEIARAQRVGWEPHSPVDNLIDEYGSRPIITVIEKQEDDIVDDLNRENQYPKSDSEQNCGNDTEFINK